MLVKEYLVALVRLEETGHARTTKVGLAKDVLLAVDRRISQVESLGPGDTLRVHQND